MRLNLKVKTRVVFMLATFLSLSQLDQFQHEARAAEFSVSESAPFQFSAMGAEVDYASPVFSNEKAVEDIWLTLYPEGKSDLKPAPVPVPAPAPAPAPKPEPAPAPEPEPNPKPEPTPTPPKKEMSEGQKRIEEMKAKVRDRLKKAHGELDRREKMKAAGLVPDEAPNPKAQMQKWAEQVRETRGGWQKQVDATYARWDRARRDFLNRVEDYKENLGLQKDVLEAEAKVESGALEERVRLSLPKGGPSSSSGSSSNSKRKKKTSGAQGSKVDMSQVDPARRPWLVKGALGAVVKDQGKRPTCAAFSGVRALETVLAQNGKELDLSEQYFYWLSKPKCRMSPCQERGSWVLTGFKESKRGDFKIPTEEDCPYGFRPNDENETQVPLAGGCGKGIAYSVQYKKLPGLKEVWAALKRGVPVVAPLRLSENFYDNRGIISLKDAKVGTQAINLDEHAKGHAVLLVGAIPLPDKMRASEGDYCLLTVNSWGEGWGLGGFGCLTESWVRKMRLPIPFVGVESLRTE